MNITCPHCGVSYDPSFPFALERDRFMPVPDAYRAMRDDLAKELFRDARSSDGYFDAETSARVALDDADIFMAERAKRNEK